MKKSIYMNYQINKYCVQLKQVNMSKSLITFLKQTINKFN